MRKSSREYIPRKIPIFGQITQNLQEYLSAFASSYDQFIKILQLLNVPLLILHTKESVNKLKVTSFSKNMNFHKGQEDDLSSNN